MATLNDDEIHTRRTSEERSRAVADPDQDDADTDADDADADADDADPD